ncbi:hypothetical protein ACIBCA_02305 [Kitasatospora sp. NPDC051170]|uniref:hypothetical protein n=1 Tax=Kitasatospora sp. NPDC051170 TaxID=3364056 RepID=UPI0037BE134D
MAMLTAGRFTVGSVLEEQADDGSGPQEDRAEMPVIDHASAFEASLALILDGLVHQQEAASAAERLG